MNRTQAISDMVDRFRAHIEKSPKPPDLTQKREHDALVVRVYECGIEWAQLSDVGGSEAEAINALSLVLVTGFKDGLRIRADVNSDSILDAAEISDQ